MNVFEDLVIELKEENLLEDTVMDAARNESAATVHAEPANITDIPIDVPPAAASEPAMGEQKAPESEYENTPVAMAVPADSDMQLQGNDETVEIRRPSSEREFFKKRAVGEVASLQMVEHVLTSVEREHMKVVPRTYDDFEAKKALNLFLKVADDVSTNEHKEAEFRLMHETESWCSALAERDHEISVANLRRYCENCRPMLSSQAMLSLARFYRNLPYSEGVRSKFDFIITRLFSRPTDEQLSGHIKTLYADWSSLSLHSDDENESNVLLTALSFEDLTAEAEKATEFDELIKSDFFNRLRLFKESITELFYAPKVTAAAIECNIRIGNAYVELIARERQKSNAAMVHDRYSFIDDQEVSQATGRTLELVELLRERSQEPVKAEPKEAPQKHQPEVVIETPAAKAEEPAKEIAVAKPKRKRKLPIDKLGVDRWLLAVSLVIILASAGLYVWANFFIAEPPTASGVTRFDPKDTAFRDDIKIAKISGDTLYVMMMPSWETMTKEKQLELLKNIYQYGATKEWHQVNIMNSTGKTVGYASSSRLELVGQ
ncbi:MAG: hypothetical protein IPG67_17335 [Acidobacteria bacterium]|nr:hypothetical protein [Acidobacteriota bacterium]